MLCDSYSTSAVVSVRQAREEAVVRDNMYTPYVQPPAVEEQIGNKDTEVRTATAGRVGRA
jgi:hypothetical protein